MSAAAVEVGVEHHNEVYLVGRLSGEPIERELPSGDLLLSWRLVVDRAPNDRAAARSSTTRCRASH
jgi:single-strand DNA-binding protein